MSLDICVPSLTPILPTMTNLTPVFLATTFLDASIRSSTPFLSMFEPMNSTLALRYLPSAAR